MPRSTTFMDFRYRKWKFVIFLKIIFGPRNVHGKGHFHLRSAAFVYITPLFPTYLYVIIHFLLCGKTYESVRAYSHQRRAFFSAAEILLRIYKNPIHLNGARWRTTFFRRWTSRYLQNLVRQQVPFKYMGFWYIRSRISAAEKTRVFGVNRPQRRTFCPSRFVRTRAFTPKQKNAGRRMNTSAVIGLDVITCW